MSKNEKQLLILLIEDDDDHAEITEFYIKENYPHMQVFRLSDGERAMKYLDKIGNDADHDYPWLILLDLKIPKYSGLEILARLKSDIVLKRVPVVIFTTSNSNKDVTDAFDSCANSYISKPIEQDAFETTIRQIVGYWLNNQHIHLVQSMNSE